MTMDKTRLKEALSSPLRPLATSLTALNHALNPHPRTGCSPFDILPTAATTASTFENKTQSHELKQPTTALNPRQLPVFELLSGSTTAILRTSEWARLRGCQERMFVATSNNS